MRARPLDQKGLERVHGGARGIIHGYWECDVCHSMVYSGEPEGECPGCLFQQMGAQGW